MAHTEFIKTLQAYAGNLASERTQLKAQMRTQPDNSDLYHRITKIGHEISAIENTIRELQRP